MTNGAKRADPSDPSVGIASPGGGTACPVPGVPAVSPYGPFAQPEPAPGHLWDAGDDTAGPRGPRLVERLETDEHGDVFVWFRDGGIGGMARHMQRRWKLAGVETEHGRVMVGETRQTPLGMPQIGGFGIGERALVGGRVAHQQEARVIGNLA